MKLNNIYVICIVLMAFFAQSCSKMNDLHQPYLDEGEIIYAAKVDSVSLGTGKGRIQFEMFIAAQRIETVRIFWNDYKDSVDVAIGGKTGSFKKLIEKLIEKSYIFQFVSFDKFGHKSLPVEVSGKVYGEVYETSLSARSVSISNSKAGLVLTFVPAFENNVSTEVTYTGGAGVLKTVSVPATESTVTIPDNLGSQVVLKSSYQPAGGVDLFYSSAVTKTFNPFAGSYVVTGTMVDKTNASLTGAYPWNVRLSAASDLQAIVYDADANTISHKILSGGANSSYGSFGVVFNFDVNGNITSVINSYGQPAANNRSAQLDPSGINKFDPVTKSFKVKYWMNQTGSNDADGHRVYFDETYVMK